MKQLLLDEWRIEFLNKTTEKGTYHTNLIASPQVNAWYVTTTFNETKAKQSRY